MQIVVKGKKERKKERQKERKRERRVLIKTVCYTKTFIFSHSSLTLLHTTNRVARGLGFYAPHTEYYHRHNWWRLLISGQHCARASSEDKGGQNMDKGH